MQHDQFWEQLKSPSAIICGLLLLATFLSRYTGTSLSVSQIILWLLDGAWNALVFIVPEAVLRLLDAQATDQASTKPMDNRHRSDVHMAKSRLMSRILGLDRSGGLMATVFQARSRALSGSRNVPGSKAGNQSPPGLGNLDNSCYQNSILQGLAALQHFPAYLSACLRISEGSDQEQTTAQNLRVLLEDLRGGSNNGRTLWTPGVLKSMSTWTQQDAQEYYSKILDDIDRGASRAIRTSRQQQGLELEDAKDETTVSQHSDDSGYQSQPSSSKNFSADSVKNPLEGLLAQRVACVQCGYSEGLSLIPFNCLTLSLGLESRQYDLYDRLDSFTAIEAIDGVNCPKCTLLKAQRLLSKLVTLLKARDALGGQLTDAVGRLEAVDLALEEDRFDDAFIRDMCKIPAQSIVNSTKTKQIVIARPPKSLVVHMNRSVFDPNTFNMMKNSAPVHFPRTLDLGPWCLGSAHKAATVLGEDEKTSGPVDGNLHLEQWQPGARDTMVARDVGDPSKVNGPIYELRAAVTHYGRHENGHYICYRRHPRSHSAIEAEAMMDPKADVSDVDDVEEETEVQTALETEEAEEGIESGADQGEWWRLSDHNVTRVDESMVLGLSPGVFMLFYDCVDPEMIFDACDVDRPLKGETETSPKIDEPTRASPDLQDGGKGPVTELGDHGRTANMSDDTFTPLLVDAPGVR